MVVSSCKLVVCSWMKAIVAVASTIALASTPTTTTAATTTSTTTTVIRRDTQSEDSSPNMESSVSGWSVQDDEYDGDDDNDGDNGNDDEYDGDDHVDGAEEEEKEDHFAYTPLPCLYRMEVSYSTVPIPYHHISSQSSHQSILHPSRTPVMSLLLEALQTDRVDCQLLLSAFELDEEL